MNTRSSSTKTRQEYLDELISKSSSLKHAAVAVIVFPYGDEWHVLLTRRSLSLRSHPGQVCFPGGKSDPGEELITTAKRELEEEVGIHEKFLTPISRMNDQEVSIVQQISLHGLCVNSFIFSLDQEIVSKLPLPGEKITSIPGYLQINPAEVEYAFHIPLSLVIKSKIFAVDCLWHGWTILKFDLEQCYPGCAPLTGLTAGMCVILAVQVFQENPEWLDKLTMKEKSMKSYDFKDPNKLSREYIIGILEKSDQPKGLKTSTDF